MKWMSNNKFTEKACRAFQIKTKNALFHAALQEDTHFISTGNFLPDKPNNDTDSLFSIHLSPMSSTLSQITYMPLQPFTSYLVQIQISWPSNCLTTDASESTLNRQFQENEMNGISSISNSMYQLQNLSANRPDPTEALQQLFSNLDTSGQGYIDQADLESAFQRVTSTGEAANLTTDQTDIEELFTRLDTDGDGKVTEEEFTNTLAEIDEQISNLFSDMRRSDAMQGMAPPPPPPPPESVSGGEDVGFTEEELIAQLEEADGTDTERTTLIENIIANFDQADTDGDGRVNLEEAMAFNQSSETSESTTSASSGNLSETNLSSDEKLMLQLMRLVQAYDIGTSSESNSTSSIEVSV
jgi:Ca2+-binding EF-hand superfamily protein